MKTSLSITSLLFLTCMLTMSGYNNNQTNFPKEYFLFGPLEIGGDFNSDGNQDIISLELISDKTKKRIRKIRYFGKEQNLLKKYCSLNPSLILNSKSGLNTLVIDKDCSTNGAIQLMNLEDLNGDGGDEIALVVGKFDPIQIDEFVVYTYCNNKWILVNTFELYPTEYEYIDLSTNLNSEKPVYRYIKRNGEIIELMSNKKGC